MAGKEIVVVSGLPRSGTSLVMQMLAAGGLEVVTDGRRRPDAHNPRGFFEDERVKRLATDTSWLDEALGKALKVVTPLLHHLPARYDYKVVLVERILDEVLRSQQRMLDRSRGPSPDLPAADLYDRYQRHLFQVRIWLDRQPNIQLCRVFHRDLIDDPEGQAQVIVSFIGETLNISDMAAAVDSDLHRNRVD